MMMKLKDEKETLAELHERILRRLGIRLDDGPLSKLSADEIDLLITKHEMWLNGDEGGELMNLDCVDLSGVDLSHCNLEMAVMTRCAFIGANLNNANLKHADLTGSDFSNAILMGADMRGSRLANASFKGACLMYTDIAGAVVSLANFGGAEYLDTVKALPGMKCPETGSFIGYKKALCGLMSEDCYFRTLHVIVELEIPEDALRSSATTSKCRCSKAKVLSVTHLDGKPIETNDYFEIYSYHDHKFRYVVGETVEVPNFDTDRWNECSTGIHFFMSRDDAVSYRMPMPADIYYGMNGGNNNDETE